MAGLNAEAAAGHFAAGRITALAPLPGGHINDTWRVETGRGAFLLQQLNARVFKEPRLVMDNVVRVTRHLSPGGRAPQLVATASGAMWLEDAGSCWRMYQMVTGAHSIESTDDPAVVREAARAYGDFAASLADLPGPPLHQTIRGFHDTPRYLALLEDVVREDPRRRGASAAAEISAARAHAPLADVLPPLLRSGEIRTRIAHHDAKLSNVLFDDATLRARCVVDLDTVMPGSWLFDFGDLVRSMTSGVAEDERDLARVAVKVTLFEAVAGGYLGAVADRLERRERELLVHAGLLITFEQAVRFLTDYLAGDSYYRVADPEHNLRRARAQFRLLESLLAARSGLERIVARA